MKYLTTEQYRLFYDTPIYPKNLYADWDPYNHEEYRREVLEPQAPAPPGARDLCASSRLRRDPDWLCQR